MLYAIGEIVLVVIGILIALQINNWNENRKDSILELEILTNLNDDIAFNILSINRVYSSDSLFAPSNRILLGILMDPRSVYDDSLQSHFGLISRYDIFSPRKMAYEALKAKGLEIIKNDSLRSQIIELYDETYLLNAHMLELKKDIHINSITIFNKRLFTLEKVGLKVPDDFETLKSDKEFINSLSYIAAESANFLEYYIMIRNKTKLVGEKIGNEIEKLNNK